MNLSAAYLVKRSANQLNKFYRDTLKGKSNKSFILVDPFKVEPTADQLIGNEKALSKAVSPYLEMQGVFTHKNKNTNEDIKIYFTIDEVVKNKHRYYLLEHKWLKDSDNPESWFFQQSIIQTAFLNALTFYSRKEEGTVLQTAKFFEGSKHSIVIPSTYYSKLVFGNDTYRVTCDQLQVMRFFVTKARTISNYARAKRFDDRYRKQEWEAYFKNFIRYRKD